MQSFAQNSMPMQLSIAESAMPAAQHDLPEFPLQELDVDYPDLSSFGDTEDFLQYIFPTPNAVVLPVSPPHETERTGTNVNQRPPTPDGILEKSLDISPPALLQLNSMIHDNVSLHVSPFIPDVRFSDDQYHSQPFTNNKFGGRESHLCSSTHAFHCFSPSSIQRSRLCMKLLGN